MAKSAAVTERAAAVYRRGRWLISNVSDVRIMWNITAGYELEGLGVACMSSDVRIVVLFDDTMPQVSVIGDIDLTVEHE
jgi:hypothetical protein